MISRIRVLPASGRATQGVIVMRLANNHTLSTIAIVPTEEDEEIASEVVETPENAE